MDSRREISKRPRVAVAALAACLATLAAVLATTARGEPSCHAIVFNGVGLGEGEQLCRDANELASGRKHQERTYWTQIAGAPHPEAEVPEGSPTPFEADLFAVRVRNAREILAGGAVCKEEAPPEQVEICERVPVIYAPDDNLGWREVYRSDEPGYVGAIAWIGKGRALAVGGTGAYPRREPNPSGSEWTYEARLQHDLAHGAGDARAWYLDDGEWEEITDSLPAEMNGFSALDVWIGREQDGSEWGLAGDYGHIWEWKGGRFTGKHIDRDSPSIGTPDPEWAVVDGPFFKQTSVNGQFQSDGSSSASFFHYRVRDIRIAPDRTQKRAFAFTAGCCGPSNAGGSRRIEYLPRPGKPQAGVPPDEAPPPNERPRWVVSNRDYGDSVYSFAVRPLRAFDNGLSPNDEYGEPKPKHNELVWETGETVSAPGGPEGEDEPSPRYVASDGDTEPTRPDIRADPVIGNGRPDWLIGASLVSDPGRDLGILKTTVEALMTEYGGIRPYCPITHLAGEVFLQPGSGFGSPQWDPGTAEIAVCRAEQIQGGTTPQPDPNGPLRTREPGVQIGPSWAVNAISMLDSHGTGYAVGDRGAILRFGAAPAEPDPPSLGARRAAQLAERSPYEERRPRAATRTNEVPALATQPHERLADPRMVRAGSPDGNEIGTTTPVEDVHTIVMSRDGSEGWAIGPSIEARGNPSASDTTVNRKGGVMTLYHYDAGQWTRCDPLGIPGIVEPDSACADLAELYRYDDSGPNKTRIRLDAATRVPLEYDSDPSNDDELEILAVGSTLETVKAPDNRDHRVPTVIRYHDGRWWLEDFEMRKSLNGDEHVSSPIGQDLTAASLACVARDECWAVALHVSNSTTTSLRRFDGQRWTDCSRTSGASLANREACGDLGNRLTRLSRAWPQAKLSVTSAGERVYLAGTRLLGGVNEGGVSAGNADTGSGAPVVLYKDRGPGEQWRADAGGYDPGFQDGAAERGSVTALSVVRRADGRYQGWAAGLFGAISLPQAVPESVRNLPNQDPRSALLRLDPDSGEWSPWTTRDASFDYLARSGFSRLVTQLTGSRILAMPGDGSTPGRAFIGASPGGPSPAWAGNVPHAFAFNPEGRRWELLETPGGARWGRPGAARPMALAPDGGGGVWAAFSTEESWELFRGLSETYFYNYTHTPRREVFEEVAHPLAEREKLTDLAGAEDGSVWVGSDQGTLHRYDRLTGWERVEIPGWDAGRVLTSRSPVNAVALGPDGSGLAVGPGGRVADVGPHRVRLDEAAGTVCSGEAPEPPCGTGFDLRSAAPAPDGSALVGGEKRALLWRPAGGEFRKVEAPDASPFATITGIALPAPNRAWVSLDTGEVFAGAGDGSGGWSWRLENAVEIAHQERLLSEDERGEPIALRDIAVDASGRGFAVGDRGLILERSGDGDEPWRRVKSGVTERLNSVALPVGEGTGALIGGDRGLVLTLTGGKWRVARSGDQLRPDNGHVVGVAPLPGVSDGQAEAWAGVAPSRERADARTGMSQLLHYASDAGEPLLDPTHGAEPVPDAPAPRRGELSLAAFGRSDCQLAARNNVFPCPPLENGTEPEQTILRRVRDEVLARSRKPGGPTFAIFTGDAYESGGYTGLEPAAQNHRGAEELASLVIGGGLGANPQYPARMRYNRFNEQLTGWLSQRGLPVFASVGARDLSESRACGRDAASGSIYCAENRDRARVGENLAWRQAMKGQPAPWGAGDAAESGEISFEPLRDSPGALRSEDYVIEEAVRVPAGGASTHYAADILRGDEPVARLIVVDTSAGSLAASDPIQQPLEPEGGQARWLEDVLCIRRSQADSGQCTRDPDQQAIVVSTTPTYSYGPTNLTETQADGALFESILLRHGANVVVSGRLGWNGRYWATAPGLHEPCPGEGYVPDSQVPEAGTRVCGQGAGEVSADAGRAEADAQKAAFDAVGDLGGTGVLPFVVASGAGGRFDEFATRSGQTSAENGFWRGYAIIRLHPSGDPRKTIVEQRPIFDWVAVSGKDRVLGARERLALRGLGRGPISSVPSLITVVPWDMSVGSPRFDELSTPAITHRYDLVLADPGRPWAPCPASDAACVKLAERLSSLSSRVEASHSDASVEGSQSASATATSLASENPCEPYLCLPERIGTVDRWTGEVRAGNGKYPDTFAIGILSVGDHVATYPLMFKKSPSFVVQPFALSAPIPAPPSAAPNPPQPPSPPNPPQPSVPQPNVPEVPPPPPVPPLAAAEPPQPQPPAPPAPPPPTEQLSPLDLTINPASLTVSTPAAVIQPPTPPVNPAPPGGARREARQRQAATQKSGADGGEQSETQKLGGDLAQSPLAGDGSSSFSRSDRVKPGPSFTPLARADQPSAWTTGLLYGGGMTLMAFAAAMAWTWGRPTPRRRTPEIPAPAYARNSRR